MIFGTLYTSMQLQRTHSFTKIPLVYYLFLAQWRNNYQFYTADAVIMWRTFLHFSEFFSEMGRYADIDVYVMLVRTNCWTNTRAADDRIHSCDVTVMAWYIPTGPQVANKKNLRSSGGTEQIMHMVPGSSSISHWPVGCPKDHKW